MKNNTIWWWVGGIVAVLIVIFLIVRMKGVSTTSMNPDNSGIQAGSDLPVSTEDVSAGSVHAASATAPVLTYQQALTKYGSRRIQFDPNCQAVPFNETFVNNTEIMLDNRAPVARNFHLGTLADISIKAWGFKIVKLYSATLPKTLLFDCDGKQNVATILIQK